MDAASSASFWLGTDESAKPAPLYEEKIINTA